MTNEIGSEIARRSKNWLREQRRQIVGDAQEGISKVVADVASLVLGAPSASLSASGSLSASAELSGSASASAELSASVADVVMDVNNVLEGVLSIRDGFSLPEKDEATMVDKLLKSYQETAAATSADSASEVLSCRDLAGKGYSPGFSERTDAIRKRIDEIRESFKYMEKTVMTLGSLDPIATMKNIRELADELDELQRGLDFEIAKNLAACSINGATQQSL